MNKKCECCGNKTDLVLNDGVLKYIICHNCISQLINTNLSPTQFRNLIRNGHSYTEFYLHEDFYDEEGNALQPQNELKEGRCLEADK